MSEQYNTVQCSTSELQLNRMQCEAPLVDRGKVTGYTASQLYHKISLSMTKYKNCYISIIKANPLQKEYIG